MKLVLPRDGMAAMQEDGKCLQYPVWWEVEVGPVWEGGS